MLRPYDRRRLSTWATTIADVADVADIDRRRSPMINWVGCAVLVVALPQPPAVRGGLHVRRPWRGRSLARRSGRRAAGAGLAPAAPAGPGLARTATGLPLPPPDRLTRGRGLAPDRRWSW